MTIRVIRGSISPTLMNDLDYMRMALKQAHLAEEGGEVPVGAIIVCNNEVIGQAHNQVELLHDPTAHAEMISITQAASAVGDWRLTEATIYVTKEPCRMCTGAILNARIPRVVFGARDPQYDSLAVLKNTAETAFGLLEKECKAALQDFFRKRRQNGS